VIGSDQVVVLKLVKKYAGDGFAEDTVAGILAPGGMEQTKIDTQLVMGLEMEELGDMLDLKLFVFDKEADIVGLDKMKFDEIVN